MGRIACRVQDAVQKVFSATNMMGMIEHVRLDMQQDTCSKFYGRSCRNTAEAPCI